MRNRSAAVAVALSMPDALVAGTSESLLLQGHIKNEQGEIVKTFAEVVEPGARLRLSAKVKNTYVAQSTQAGDQKPKPQIESFETGLDLSLSYRADASGKLALRISGQDIYANPPPKKPAALGFPGAVDLPSITMKAFSVEKSAEVNESLSIPLAPRGSSPLEPVRYTLDLTFTDL